MKEHNKIVRLILLSTLVLISYLFTFWRLGSNSYTISAEVNTPSTNIQRDILGGNDDEEIVDTKILENGKILSLGYGSNASYYRNIVIFRYNSNGTLDTSFNGGLGYTTVVENKQVDPERMAIQSDGKIVVTGDKYVDDTNKFDMILWRFNSDGSLDTTFNGTGIVTHHNAAGGNEYDTGKDVIITASSKILVVGNSKSATSNDRDLIVWKYNSDGTLDTSFDSDGIFLVSTADCSGCADLGYKLDIDSSNKIVITGHRVIPDVENGLVVYRVNENGGLDTSFNTTGSKLYSLDGYADEDNYPVKIQSLSNGKYLIGGYSQNINPPYNNVAFVMRLNSDSTLDTSFNSTGYKIIDLITNSIKIYDFTIEPSGNYILVGEKFGGGVQDVFVTRLLTNGATDTSFGTNGVSTYDNIGGGDGYEKASAIDSKDNKYYIAGISEGATTYTDSFMLVLTNTYQVRNLLAGLKSYLGENDVTLGSAYGTYGSQTLEIKDSNTKIITNLNATFNKDLDFTSFSANTNLETYKSYVGTLSGISGISTTYDLYIPKKDGDNVVGLCPNQTNFENINVSCIGYSRVTNPISVAINNINYWKLASLTSPYGAFSQNFQVSKVKIDSIGLITKIPEKDSLKYYFLSSALEIKGSADPNVTVKFKLGDNYYTTVVDSSGKYSIEIKNVPTGSNVFSYFAVSSDNIESEKRTLEMVLGCENFTTTLKDIYCPDSVDEESLSTSSTTSLSLSTTSSSSNKVTILFRDNSDSPILGVSVFIGDKTYITDKYGAIEVDKATVKGEAKILVNGQTFIQDLNSKDEIKIIVAIDPNFAKQSSKSSLNTGISINNYININTIPYILGCLILTLIIMVFVFILRKRKKKKIEEEFRISP